MSNVIKFPKKNALPTTREDAKQVIDAVRQEYVDCILEDVIHRLFSDIESYGIILKNDHLHRKDMIFVTETIQALLMRYCSLDHSMHSMIDEAIRFDDEQPVKKKRGRPKKKLDKEVDAEI